MLNELLRSSVGNETNGLEASIHKYTDWNLHVTYNGNNRRPRFAEAIAIMLETVYEMYYIVSTIDVCHIDEKWYICSSV